MDGAVRMDDPVNHPSHYCDTFQPVNIECISITRHMPFVLGNAFKYVWRAGRKGDAVEDIKKAIWYLRDYEGTCTHVDQHELDIAVSIFNLIPEANTRQWRALASILDMDTESAISFLKHMLPEAD